MIKEQKLFLKKGARAKLLIVKWDAPIWCSGCVPRCVEIFNTRVWIFINWQWEAFWVPAQHKGSGEQLMNRFIERIYIHCIYIVCSLLRVSTQLQLRCEDLMFRNTYKIHSCPLCCSEALTHYDAKISLFIDRMPAPRASTNIIKHAGGTRTHAFEQHMI